MSLPSPVNLSDPALAGANDAVWVRLQGPGHSFVRRDWLIVFADAGLREAKDFFSVTGETLSKPGLKGRYRARLHLQKQGETQPVYLKRFTGETLLARVRRWLETGHWQTAAGHELRVSLELEQQQILVAQPLAWGCRPAGGPDLDSFIVLAAVPGESMHLWTRNMPPDRRAQDWRQTCGWVAELAGQIRRFHGHGWCHRDLYLSHIFISRTGDHSRFTMIDLQRIFRPRWRKQRWLIKDLAQLNYSAGNRFTRSMRMRFARHYFGGGKLTGAQKELLRKIQKKTVWIARHSRA